MLGNAVVHAAAVDVPVRPETRIDTDIAAGIVRAVKELRASCVIIGWNFRAVEPHVVFSTVLDQLLNQTFQLLLVCKI
ncbi:MAG TPA: cation:proton antiporter, partial [Deltaproteobacteria bacterium]|nr:cation:proton antiporter [Deltaproteobacteria bacterium]